MAVVSAFAYDCTRQTGVQAEQSVEAEAERRVGSIGGDRTRWPAPAREEVLRLEKKQQVGILASPSAALHLSLFGWLGVCACRQQTLVTAAVVLLLQAC